MAHMVKGRQYMHSRKSLHVLCLNHSRQIDSRPQRQIDVSVTETNSAAQYISVCSTRTRIACMNVCVLYIALASFIYTWDYVSQKNA